MNFEDNRIRHELPLNFLQKLLRQYIYFYQEVTPKSVMELGVAIKTIGQQIINMVTDLFILATSAEKRQILL